MEPVEYARDFWEIVPVSVKAVVGVLTLLLLL